MAPSLGRSAFYLLQSFLIYSCDTLVKLKVPAQLFLRVECHSLQILCFSPISPTCYLCFSSFFFSIMVFSTVMQPFLNFHTLSYSCSPSLFFSISFYSFIHSCPSYTFFAYSNLAHSTSPTLLDAAILFLETNTAVFLFLPETVQPVS